MVFQYLERVANSMWSKEIIKRWSLFCALVTEKKLLSCLECRKKEDELTSNGKSATFKLVNNLSQMR